MVVVQSLALKLCHLRLLRGADAVEGDLRDLLELIDRLRQHLGLLPELQPQRQRRHPAHDRELPQGGNHLAGLLLRQVQA